MGLSPKPKGKSFCHYCGASIDWVDGAVNVTHHGALAGDAIIGPACPSCGKAQMVYYAFAGPGLEGFLDSESGQVFAGSNAIAEAEERRMVYAIREDSLRRIVTELTGLLASSLVGRVCLGVNFTVRANTFVEIKVTTMGLSQAIDAAGGKQYSGEDIARACAATAERTAKDAFEFFNKHDQLMYGNGTNVPNGIFTKGKNKASEN